MKCGKYDCGWCFDKSGKNNSADGACMFPELCDLNKVEFIKALQALQGLQEITSEER